MRSHDAATRKVLSEKVNQYKKSLGSHRNDFESVRDSAQRRDLMGLSGEQRQRFLDTNDKCAVAAILSYIFVTSSYVLG